MEEKGKNNEEVGGKGEKCREGNKDGGQEGRNEKDYRTPEITICTGIKSDQPDGGSQISLPLPGSFSIFIIREPRL